LKFIVSELLTHSYWKEAIYVLYGSDLLSQSDKLEWINKIIDQNYEIPFKATLSKKHHF